MNGTNLLQVNPGSVSGTMRRQKTGFNSPCKLLERRWREEYHEKHRRKLEEVTSTVDSRAPRDYFHLHVKLKKLWLEEQRNVDIRKENARLLGKMDVIMRKGGWTESWNNYESRSLNADKRRREMVETMQENQRLLQRITQRTPVIISQEWRRYLQPAPRAGSYSPGSTSLLHKPGSRTSNISDSKVTKVRGHRSASVSPYIESTKNLLSFTMSEMKLRSEEKLPPLTSVTSNQPAIGRRKNEDGVHPEIVISQPVDPVP